MPWRRFALSEHSLVYGLGYGMAAHLKHCWSVFFLGGGGSGLRRSTINIQRHTIEAEDRFAGLAEALLSTPVGRLGLLVYNFIVKWCKKSDVQVMNINYVLNLLC